jgi:folate-binding protein YgfZ
MGITALQAHGEGLGASGIGNYRGAETAAFFNDVNAEFTVLRTECAVYDLGFRARIELKGSDRVRWLNGMVTNNVRDLAEGRGVYAFLLNPQGHILGDMYAYNRGASITVDTDRDQLEKITATFDHYIIMDDVEVQDLSNGISALGIAGPAANDVLMRAGIAVEQLQPLQISPISWESIEATIVRTDDESVPAYEIWLPPNSVRPAWDRLVAAGSKPAGSEALELHRIVSGVPRYGVDIRERDLPQETEQARALNFSKGCYVGQEIVERIRSRGAVRRTFTGFVASDSSQIIAGSKIVAAEKEVGEITSSAIVNVLNGPRSVALGYIRREAGAPGKEVSIGSSRASIVQMPLSDSFLFEKSNSLQQRPA